MIFNTCSIWIASEGISWLAGNPIVVLVLAILVVALLVSLIVTRMMLAKCRRRTREAQQRLKEVTAESAELQSAFIANMTHEIRTPLNAIIGFVQVLAETDGLSRDDRMVFLQEIDENRRSLLQIIGDLLDYSKIETGSLDYKDEEVDVNAVIDELCGVENSRASHKVRVSFGEKQPQCRLRIDRSRFTQVLGNLVQNALKFTEEGGIQVGYRRLKNGNFYFYVADTGCGMDEESRHAIFDRFVKMNYNIKGTGLGLAIAKSIVEHYGGGIGVESKKGEGSTFYFTLPASREFKEFGRF